MDLPPAGRPRDVLSQPTRGRLFAALGDMRRPASTDELAQAVDLHPNGVRTHLERLRSAGLVIRSREPQPLGRPRDQWSIAPGAEPTGDPPVAYADLGRWLARAIPNQRSRLRDVEAAGREIGRELAPSAKPRSVGEAMQTVLAALGFQPQAHVRSGGLCFELGNCPYRDAVNENQEVVCTLHRGITRGLLDALAPQTKLAGFIPRDPYSAGCLIELEDMT